MWGWLKSIGSFFTGGSKMADKAADMIDESFYTKQEEATDFSTNADKDSIVTAKLMQESPRIVSQYTFDRLVDNIKRLERPAWGLYFFGAFCDWWELPDFSNIKVEVLAFWITLFTIYFTALFGGRALFKDLAGAIASILKAKK